MHIVRRALLWAVALATACATAGCGTSAVAAPVRPAQSTATARPLAVTTVPAPRVSRRLSRG